jgi:hypothetical protein
MNRPSQAAIDSAKAATAIFMKCDKSIFGQSDLSLAVIAAVERDALERANATARLQIYLILRNIGFDAAFCEDVSQKIYSATHVAMTLEYKL